jgi:hypothetical protein
MPDRALIPLIAALAGGFIAGACTAVTQVYSPEAWYIGVPVAVLVAITGFVSVIKTPGEESERWIVGALRAAIAVACFGFLYAGILVAVRDGSPLGLLWLVFAGGFAVLLTRFRVRERGELQAN